MLKKKKKRDQTHHILYIFYDILSPCPQITNLLQLSLCI